MILQVSGSRKMSVGMPVTLNRSQRARLYGFRPPLLPPSSALLLLSPKGSASQGISLKYSLNSPSSRSEDTKTISSALPTSFTSS